MAVKSRLQLINKNEIEIIRGLEESLWRSETRFNQEYMEQILAPDFFEFGRSGRVYTRAEILAAANTKIRCTLPLKNFSAQPLDGDIVLVTYISEVYEQEWQFANRSSIWIKNPSGWQLRFHQGTPIPRKW